MVEVTISSDLPADRDAVWARVTTLEGINDELGPFLTMTAPRGAELTIDAAPLGRRWFRSWILLFGVIPIDFDDLTLVSIDPPNGFHERSRTLSATVWEHKRTLGPSQTGGTRITDEVRAVPRVARSGAILTPIVAGIFRLRHRRLRRAFD